MDPLGHHTSTILMCRTPEPQEFKVAQYVVYTMQKQRVLPSLVGFQVAAMTYCTVWHRPNAGILYEGPQACSSDELPFILNLKDRSSILRIEIVFYARIMVWPSLKSSCRTLD